MAKTYESEVRVKLDAKELKREADEVEKKIDKVRGSLGRFKDGVAGVTKNLAVMSLGAAGLGVGLGALIHKMVEANMELDSMSDKVAGTLYAFRRWKSGVSEAVAVDRSIADARGQVEELEKTSLQLAVASEEVAFAYQSLAGPALQTFGKSEEDLLRLTKGATAAMQVFQKPGMEVAQIVRGLLEQRRLMGSDPLVVRLRGFLGTAKEIKAMKPEQLFDKTVQALEKLTPAAEKLSTGLDSQMFRLRKQLSDNLRGVAGPAFAYIVEKAQAFNTWLKSTNAEGKTMAEVWGDKILRGVKAVEGALVFVRNHWREIAIVVGAIKLGPLVSSALEFGSALSGALKSAGLLGGALGSAGAAGARGASGLVGLVAQLGGATNMAVLGLGALAAGAYAFAQWVDGQQTKRIRRNEEVGTHLGQAAVHQGQAHFGKAREQTRKMLGALEAGGLVENGRLVPDFAKQVQNLSDDQRRMIGSLVKVGEGSMSPGMHSALIAETFQKRFSERKKWFPDLFEPKKEAAQAETPLPALKDLIKPGRAQVIWNQNGPINLHQEFKEAEPDNVYVRFREDLEAQAANRVTSSLMETYAP